MLLLNSGHVQAINETANPAAPGITGLWNTGVKDDGTLVELPPNDPAYPNPAPAYGVNHTTPYNEDPHWQLTGVRTLNSAANSCQTGPFPRQAVTVRPPYDASASPSNPGWVWWRNTIGSASLSGALWIGARPNAFHDSIVAPFNDTWQSGNGAATCNGGSGDPSDPASPARLEFTYKLNQDFHVSSCAVLNSIRLNPRWGADNDFQMWVNNNRVFPDPNDPLQPEWAPGGSIVTSTTALGTGAYRVGYNSLEIKVRSSYPLTGFAISWAVPDVTCPQAKPYFKIYGNDIAAGGQFGSCDLTTLPNNRATILGQNRGSQNPGYTPLVPQDHYYGASTQLAAFALGQVYSFFSGGNQSPRRSAVPSSPVNGLTFGNFGDPTIDSAGNWDTSGNILDPNKVLEDGGKGGQFRCMPDYFSVVSQRIGSPQTVTGPINLANTTAGYYQTTGVATISNGTGMTGKRAIVVDGDVYISANGINGITYGGYTNANGMPSVYIIAKGNIYIDSNIRNLSGVYIAQPRDDGTKGTIYTCATFTGPILDTNLRDNCNQNLTVAGAFIANRVRLLRTNGDVASSTANELWNSSANIAEVFKSSAELYLSAPDQLRRSTATGAVYDSITSLPPVL